MGTEPKFTEKVVWFNGHRITVESQRRCFMGLQKAGPDGFTSQEIEDRTGMGHGKVSGALSRLHEYNYAALLQEKRGGQQVYVRLDWVGDRPTTPRRNQHCAGCRCDRTEEEL